MPDIPLLMNILSQILEGIHRIERRIEGIDSAEDFLREDENIDRLDAIGMMLIAIGESLKKFERSGGKPLMDMHPEVDWKGAKGVRDFLSHHYFDLDAEVVFAICKDRIPGLKETILAIQKELQNRSF
jgi:uncharacterized protein with HEPN domain